MRGTGIDRWPYKVRLRFRSLFRRARVERELTDELCFHLDRLTEEKLADGLTPDEARYAALRELGGLQQVKEQCRDTRRVNHVENGVRDLRYGFRQLRRAPGFASVAVLTLALGIGANAAIFSVIERVMLQPLPFPGADRLVRIYSTRNGVRVGNHGGPSPMDMRDLARRNHSFEQIVAYDTWRKNVSFGDRQIGPQQMWVGLVPDTYFAILHMKPVMGRLFTPQESDVGKHYVAAISASLWKARFAGDGAILGRTIRINDEPYTIVAVMPDVIPEWMEGQAVQIWTPFGFADSSGDLWTEVGRGARGWYSLGCLKPSVSAVEAQADLATIAAALAAAHPIDRGAGVALEPLSDTRADHLRSTLFLLASAVALILLIACVNLTNLLLARNSVRARELAARVALGAGRGRVVGQMLAETLLLSLIGGGIGLVLAEVGIKALTRIHPRDLPQLADIGIDWRVFMFTLAVSLATAFLFGVGPALAVARVNLVDNLKPGSRSTTGDREVQRVRDAMVVAETAMSLMLLVGAGLLIRTVVRLERQPLGIRSADHLLAGHFYLPPTRYPDAGTIARFSDRFADHVRALPGVVEASITTIYPPAYDWPQMVEIRGRPVTRIQDVPSVQCGFTDAHFLRTMGIRLIRGRDFNESDTAASEPVALVSEAFVRRYVADVDAIGLRLHIGPPQFLNVPDGGLATDASDVTIVGIFGDFRNNGLAVPPGPQIIVLYSQHPLVTYGFRDIVIRTSANPHVMVAEITRQLQAMDAELPFTPTGTIDELVGRQAGSQRFTTLLLGAFAGLGLMLAGIGVYGVVSYSVAQRTREIGVRMALGAQRADVLRGILAQGFRPAAVGIVIGIAVALVVTRSLASLLYGVTPSDPLTFIVVSLVLSAVALLASGIPARRAAKVDPMIALRHE